MRPFVSAAVSAVALATVMAAPALASPDPLEALKEYDRQIDAAKRHPRDWVEARLPKGLASGERAVSEFPNDGRAYLLRARARLWQHRLKQLHQNVTARQAQERLAKVRADIERGIELCQRAGHKAALTHAYELLSRVAMYEVVIPARALNKAETERRLSEKMIDDRLRGMILEIDRLGGPPHTRIELLAGHQLMVSQPLVEQLQALIEERYPSARERAEAFRRSMALVAAYEVARSAELRGSADARVQEILTRAGFRLSAEDVTRTLASFTIPKNRRSGRSTHGGGAIMLVAEADLAQRAQAIVQASRTKAENFAPPRQRAAVELPQALTQDLERAAGRSLQQLVAAAQKTLTLTPEQTTALRALKVEVVPGSEARASLTGGPGGGVIQVSQGLLAALVAAEGSAMPSNASQRRAVVRRVLGPLSVALAHEVGHQTGAKSDRAADRRAAELIGAAGLKVGPGDGRRLVEAFGRSGAGPGAHLADFAYKLRHLAATGSTPERRAGELEQLIEQHRRANGTVRWQEVLKRGGYEAGHLAQFGLALFLKELTVAIQSGEKARIDEFFQALQSTDFYLHYGLFMAGARSAQVMFQGTLGARLETIARRSWAQGRGFQGDLARHLSKQLGTSVTLAAGLALPQIVDGTFESKPFVISLASLHLSVGLVEMSLGSVRSLERLKASYQAGKLRGLARVGGFSYSVAELAVILLAAEQIDRYLTQFLEEKAARQALSEAAGQLLREALPDSAAPDLPQLGAALDAYSGAWRDFRNYLYRPAVAAEAAFAKELEGLARRAQQVDQAYERLLTQAGEDAELRRLAESQFGGVEDYAAAKVSERDAEIEQSLTEALTRFEGKREALLAKLYGAQRREGALLQHPISDLSAAARDHRRAAENRLQSYDDEREVLDALARELDVRGHGEAAARIRSQARSVAALGQRDAALFVSDAPPDRAPANVFQRLGGELGEEAAGEASAGGTGADAGVEDEQAQGIAERIAADAQR